MKNLFSILLMLMSTTLIFAQQPKMAVVSFDVTNTSINTKELTEILRIEVSKHNKYEIIDRYEIQEILNKEQITTETCLSKSCLLQAGKILNVDYLLSGSADKLGESLYLRIRLLNLKAGSIEKEAVREFLFIPEKINTMVSLCVNDIVGVENDKVIESSLSNKDSYENALNNPYYQTLNLSGPRMGYSFFLGKTADILALPKAEGGFNASPTFFQMGYQFEKQYLSEGKWQALVEFIPLISGLDQGLFIPSLSILNGIRSNVNGLEFAIGPTFTANKRLEDRLDSRGEFKLSTNVVIAAGFSLKSGKLNIPINAYFVPAKDDLRLGISFGFNTRNNR
jgi:TolB-like protein